MCAITLYFFDDRPALAAYQDIPARYDHVFEGVLIEFSETREGIVRQCGKDADACTLLIPNFVGDKCAVVLPFEGRGGVSKGTRDYLKRHEIAHCNGWSKDHED